jgi:hypothetical protein
MLILGLLGVLWEILRPASKDARFEGDRLKYRS